MNLNFKKIATAFSASAAAIAMSAAFSITAEALDAPTITAQTESSSSYASFQWNPVNGADNYVTRYSYDGGATWIDEGKAYSTKDTIFDLVAGGSYLVQVAATNYEKEQSAWSAPFEIVTIPDTSYITSGVTGFQTGATTNAASFQWGVAPGATGYNLYLEANNQFFLIDTVLTNAYTTTPVLTPDTKYTFYIAPFKMSASGYVAQPTINYTWSVPDITVTTLAKKPTINIGFATYANDVSDAYVALPESNATGYYTRFYNAKGKLITEKYSDTYSWSSVKPGSSAFKYGSFCKVKAASYLEINNQKIFSETATKSFIFQPKVNLKQSKGKLTLSWKKVSKAQKYEVYVSYNQKDGYKKVATLSNKKTSYTLKKFKGTKVSSNKTYYVYVKPITKGATSISPMCFWLY